MTSKIILNQKKQRSRHYDILIYTFTYLPSKLHYPQWYEVYHNTSSHFNVILSR